jgi:hypothetical protein
MSKCVRGTLSALFATVCLVACGGGGDSPTPPVQNAPPAPPPVSPSPQSLLPPAPFGLTSSHGFTVLGWTDALGASWSEITGDTTGFSWSATIGTYQAELPGAGSGRLIYTFPGNNPVAFSLQHADGSTAPLSMTVSPGGPQRRPLQAAGRLWWSPLDGAGLSTGIAAFGMAAAASEIPSSGTRNFVGNDEPEYAPTLDFDFGAGQLTGQVRIAWEDAWGPYPATTFNLAPASFDRTTNEFSSTFSVPGAPAPGSIHGMFMGPGAREVAIAWQSPIVDPYSSQWVTLRGVWLGYCRNCGS